MLSFEPAKEYHRHGAAAAVAATGCDKLHERLFLSSAKSRGKHWPTNVYSLQSQTRW